MPSENGVASILIFLLVLFDLYPKLTLFFTPNDHESLSNGRVSLTIQPGKIISVLLFDPYLCAKDPVSRELNKTIVSSRSHINTLSTVLSTSSGLPPFWLLRLVLQLLLVEFTLAPPLPEFRFLESFFRATKKHRYEVIFSIWIYRS